MTHADGRMRDRLRCTTDKYAALYARWLVDPGKLLDIGKFQAGEHVIDLCGGTGIIAKEALARGAAEAYVVDLNAARALFGDGPLVTSLTGRAEEVDVLFWRFLERRRAFEARLPTLRRQRRTKLRDDVDLVVCRQAINYLDVGRAARATAHVLADGGRFVFNTFVRPKWSWKAYRFNGRSFFEASAFVGHRVFHLQASPTIGVDVSRFRWHTERELDSWLAPYFTVEKQRTTTSLYYLCTKRGIHGQGLPSTRIEVP